MKQETHAFGVRALLSAHKKIRRIKEENAPSLHGYKHWASSWLLIDYIRSRGLRPNSHVLDIGCGWGLVGIYCAKSFKAEVTAVDKDISIFPYLDLHVKINNVTISMEQKGYKELRQACLKDIDVILGSDICFWDSLISPLKLLILRGLRAGIRAVLISDPGRDPFEELGNYFVKKKMGEIIDWSTLRPNRIQGRILRIEIKNPQSIW